MYQESCPIGTTFPRDEPRTPCFFCSPHLALKRKSIIWNPIRLWTPLNHHETSIGQIEVVYSIRYSDTDFSKPLATWNKNRSGVQAWTSTHGLPMPDQTPYSLQIQRPIDTDLLQAQQPELYSLSPLLSSLFYYTLPSLLFFSLLSLSLSLSVSMYFTLAVRYICFTRNLFCSFDGTLYISKW